ncbi:MAG: ATP-binding cassette domain-containing protein [Chloroflexi bacterium]|nr:ATP-binding cassette domain-containing protein [Chloroflexota bacterium]
MNKLDVRDLVVRYGRLTAVDGVSFGIPAGGTLGLVGESGSGKSTIARAIVQLAKAGRGQILLDGMDITVAHGADLNEMRSRIQMIFQDPYSSLNPRLSVGAMIDEVLRRHRNMKAAQRRLEIGRLLEMVALDPLFADRYPHQFSGGQRQRIAIARTLASQPELVILDEVVSALDVSVQAAILNLLRDLQREFRLSFLFISHDLSVVRYMSDSVCVMYLGQIVEWKETEDLFRQPEHPYTQGLIDSIPKMIAGGDPNRIPLRGEIPDPHFPPPACRFHTRCPFGPLAHPERNRCREDDPHRLIDKSEHYAACHFPLVRQELA